MVHLYSYSGRPFSFSYVPILPFSFLLPFPGLPVSLQGALSFGFSVAGMCFYSVCTSIVVKLPWDSVDSFFPTPLFFYLLSPRKWSSPMDQFHSRVHTHDHLIPPHFHSEPQYHEASLHFNTPYGLFLHSRFSSRVYIYPVSVSLFLAHILFSWPLSVIVSCRRRFAFSLLPSIRLITPLSLSDDSDETAIRPHKTKKHLQKHWNC